MRKRGRAIVAHSHARRWFFRGLTVAALLPLVGCTLLTTGATTQETLDLIRAQNPSGCFYMRGNGRPYADLTILSVSTYGPKAPTYIECLGAIPDAARTLLQP